ncbi:MAG: hypothetical protein AAGB51_10895 [Planctomycetota bacterium]
MNIRICTAAASVATAVSSAAIADFTLLTMTGEATARGSTVPALLEIVLDQDAAPDMPNSFTAEWTSLAMKEAIVAARFEGLGITGPFDVRTNFSLGRTTTVRLKNDETIPGTGTFDSALIEIVAKTGDIESITWSAQLACFTPPCNSDADDLDLDFADGLSQLGSNFSSLFVLETPAGELFEFEVDTFIAETVRTPPFGIDDSPADLTTTGATLPGATGYGVPDGVVDLDDLGYFIFIWLGN